MPERVVSKVLARLSSGGRCRAGWILALVYLLCMLAPTFAFAFGGARLSDHCLFDDHPVAMATHQPDAASGKTDVHSSGPEHVTNHGGSVHHHDNSMQMADKATPASPHNDQHAPIEQQCCGVLCIAALPATISEVATLPAPHAFLVPEAEDHLVEISPALLYRPPIS